MFANVQVTAGLAHCLGVTQKGDVVSWGWNAADQLGLGPSQKQQVVYNPTQVCPDLVLQHHYLACSGSIYCTQ